MFSFWAKSVCNLLIAGISVSNLTDGVIVFHITCEDPKQKVCRYIINKQLLTFCIVSSIRLIIYYSVTVSGGPCNAVRPLV